MNLYKINYNNYSLNKILIFLFTFFVLFFIFSPFSLTFPDTSLDGSWANGLNEIISNKLSFGKDINFTFGPYSSVYTKMFHPKVIHLTYLGFFIIILSLSLVFSFLWINGYKEMFALYVLFFLVFNPGIDLTLISTLLFLIPFVFLRINTNTNVSINDIIVHFLVFSITALLPLVKGTMIIAPIFSLIFSIIFFLNKEKKLSFITMFSLFFFICILWFFAKQDLSNIINYFIGMKEIIKGYPSAMSKSPPNFIIFLFFILLFFTYIIYFFYIIYHNNKFGIKYSTFFILLYLIFYFIIYKHGFTRDNGIYVFQFQSILLGFISIYPFYRNKRVLIYLLPIFFLLVFYIVRYDQEFSKSTKNKFGDNIVLNLKNYNFYMYSLKNIPYFFFKNIIINFKIKSNSLNQFNYSTNLNLYSKSLKEINDTLFINKLDGNTDIYPFDITFLTSSKNSWNPRPVFQSYSSYTPKLIEDNFNHINNTNAPDNILFRIQTIDNRLPSIDDGVSWLAILEKYDLIKMKSGLLYFKKKKTYTKNHIIKYKTLKYKFNQPIINNFSNNEIIFAKIEINNNFLGDIYNFIYKPQEFYIEYYFQDKTIKKYRIIPNMLKNGVCIYPFVSNTESFLKLIDINSIKNKAVYSIKIIPENKYLVNSSFELKMQKLINTNSKKISLTDSVNFYNKIPLIWWKPNETLTTSLN